MMTTIVCKCITAYIYYYIHYYVYIILYHQFLNLVHTVIQVMPFMFFHLPAMIVQVFDRLLHLRGKEGLKFMVQGDLGSGNVVLKPREGEKPEEKVGFGILEIHKTNTFIFYL